MLINTGWLLLLPIAAASGWLAAMSKKHFLKDKKDTKALSKEYLKGINYLLNEEHDKALELFIKMLEVDTETVETHLALGNLFRRRGEIERATRIHQNLIARPNLSTEYRTQALLALAKDYLTAGVLDRSERLFLELLEMGKHVRLSQLKLLEIYEQEKEWEKAINVAIKCGTEMKSRVAHYYCELAEESSRAKNHNQAKRLLKKALSIDKFCVRASLLLAKIEMLSGGYKLAIRYLKRIKEQNVSYLIEAVEPLAKAYDALDRDKEMVEYFQNLLKEHPDISIMMILSEKIRQNHGDKVTADFVADYVRKHPSIEGLHRLVELYMPLSDEKAQKDLNILGQLTGKLLNEHSGYQCTVCGVPLNQLYWQCPGCKNWSTIRPKHVLDLDI